MSEVATEGFDLDALAGEDNSEVIFEIGGGATVVPNEQEASSSSPPPSADVPETPTSRLDQAEEWKQRGNEEFKKGNYLEAYDMYTNAIEECPCPVKAEDVMRQRDEFDEMEREKARSRMEEETQQRNRETNKGKEKEENNTKVETSTPSDKAQQQKEQQQQQPQGPATFELEPQENGGKLAIFLNNRAASLVQLQRFEEAIKDADIALLLNPKYTKAYIRRSSAYEKTERTEEALRDAKRALELEPSNFTIRKSVKRLQKIEDERLEKLKVRSKG
jgi:tetratricopeptide (TPR) repeat protein